MKLLQQKGQQLLLKRQALQAKTAAEPDGGYTDEQITEIETLTAEVVALDEEVKKLKGIEQALAANTVGLKDLATPVVQPVPGQVAVKAHQVTTRLKSFRGEKAVEKAYQFGMWALAAIGGSEKAAKYCRENGISLKSQVESENTAGGYLVPEQFLNEMIDLREQFGVFRRYARIVQMTSDSLSVPRRKGGLQTYYVGEGDEIPDSKIGWDRVKLTARKLAALAKMSSELAEDAVISIGDELFYEIAYAISLAEDQAGFNGDGSAAYGGIIGLSARFLGLNQTKANIAGLVIGSGAGFGGLLMKDFRHMTGILPVYADTPSARWFAHKLFFHDVMLPLAEAAGGTTKTEMIEGQRTPMFLGYPVEFVQVMPKDSANNVIPCYLGDIRLAAMLGDRRQMTLATSEHAAFESDETVVRATQRYDINVHDVGNANADAAKRVVGPLVALYTGA